ncbi:transposase, partial [Nocardia sp. NPDC004711]
GESRTPGSGWGSLEKEPSQRKPRQRPTSALWHPLAGAVETAVAAHARRWAAAGPKRQTSTRETTTRGTTTLQRWHAVRNLLDNGVGRLDCARRLGLALNTVKRYARTAEPDQLRRPPQYRACLVDPYRDHLRQRREAEPGVPVLHLFHEIKALGYTGGINLLHKYLNQPRAEGDRLMPSPRRLTSWTLSKPTDLPAGRRTHLDELLAACPEMTDLASLIGEFAAIMTERRGSDLDAWIRQVREAGLGQLEPFLRGPEKDRSAAVAGLTLPYSNAPIEGVNTKTTLIKRRDCCKIR